MQATKPVVADGDAEFKSRQAQSRTLVLAIEGHKMLLGHRIALLVVSVALAIDVLPGSFWSVLLFIVTPISNDLTNG